MGIKDRERLEVRRVDFRMEGDWTTELTGWHIAVGKIRLSFYCFKPTRVHVVHCKILCPSRKPTSCSMLLKRQRQAINPG